MGKVNTTAVVFMPDGKSYVVFEGTKEGRKFLYQDKNANRALDEEDVKVNISNDHAQVGAIGELDVIAFGDAFSTCLSDAWAQALKLLIKSAAEKTSSPKVFSCLGEKLKGQSSTRKELANFEFFADAVNAKGLGCNKGNVEMDFDAATYPDITFHVSGMLPPSKAMPIYISEKLWRDNISDPDRWDVGVIYAAKEEGGQGVSYWFIDGAFHVSKSLRPLEQD